MKIIRISVYVIGATMAVLLLFSFWLPPQASVQVDSEIACSSDDFWPLINDLTFWEAWSPFHANSENVNVSYSFSEVTAGANATQAWPAAGTMRAVKITESVANEKVVFAVSDDDEKTLQGGFEILTDDESSVNVRMTLLTMPTTSPLQRIFFYFTAPTGLEQIADRSLSNLSSVCADLE